MEYKLNQIWITRNGDTAKIIEIFKDGGMFCRLTSDGEIRMYDAGGLFSCPDLDLVKELK